MEALEVPSQRSDAEIQASSSSPSARVASFCLPGTSLHFAGVPDQPEQSGEDSEPTEPPVCIRSRLEPIGPFVAIPQPQRQSMGD